ncbi:hypothetical protein WISP_143853 [Willisornis vidua]|uniref:Rna-directed dna polymerase from mobile element jockey-like n=1 Tax=Willisornis vidua TaxID=1566151 RepID=A0ABQ9CLB4_9PASS|nr:hypothetical protein WISP_143853 [Willisornis vidua]
MGRRAWQDAAVWDEQLTKTVCDGEQRALWVTARSFSSCVLVAYSLSVGLTPKDWLFCRRKGCIQEDLDKLGKWGHENLMKFNKPKCKVLPLGQSNPKHKYKLGDELIKSSTAKKDLPVLVDEELDTTQQCALSAQKIDCILHCVKASGRP